MLNHRKTLTNGEVVHRQSHVISPYPPSGPNPSTLFWLWLVHVKPNVQPLQCLSPQVGCTVIWLLEMGLGPLGWIALSRSVQEILEESLARWSQFQALRSHGPGFKLRSSALPSYVEIHSSSVSLHLSICEGQGIALASWALSYRLREKAPEELPTECLPG